MTSQVNTTTNRLQTHIKYPSKHPVKAEPPTPPKLLTQRETVGGHCGVYRGGIIKVCRVWATWPPPAGKLQRPLDCVYGVGRMLPVTHTQACFNTRLHVVSLTAYLSPNICLDEKCSTAPYWIDLVFLEKTHFRTCVPHTEGVIGWWM